MHAVPTENRRGRYIPGTESYRWLQLPTMWVLGTEFGSSAKASALKALSHLSSPNFCLLRGLSWFSQLWCAWQFDLK